MSPPIPVDKIQVDISDEDSLLDADTESIVDSSLSLASSVRDYCYENGRRYHSYRHGQYPMPNDEQEQERLDDVHLLFKLLLNNNLARAPITQFQQPRRILDMGTGTGVWAIEMAERFPTAEVVGVDLSPIQPNSAPSNCKFFVDDLESEWTYTHQEAFDYIHGRAMGGAVADWPRILQQAYQHLKPGGWIEFQEYDSAFYSDDGTHEKVPFVMEWVRKLNDASVKFGKPINIGPRLEQWLQNAGFVNITDDARKVPLGQWAKEPQLKFLGKYAKVSVVASIEPYTLALFTRVLGYTYDEAQEYMERIREEFETPKCHVYGLYRFVYAQKPLDG